MKNPLVSIVICCYNRGHLLPKTMASVFAQKYKPVEIVVVDDGSTDNTRELMASYGGRVRYYWQENQGIAITRTNACLLAKGEFIAFQDDDDLMVPDRIVRLYEALCQHPSAVISFGDCSMIDADGNLTGQRSKFKIRVHNEEPVLIKQGYKAVLWSKIDIKPHTSLFRRVDGCQIAWFDTRFFHACEDTDFFARCGQLGPIVYVPRVVSYYRRGVDSLTTKKILLGYSQLLLFEKHLNSIRGNQKELKKRLRIRLLRALKKIAFCQSKGLKMPDSVPDNYLNRGLSLLGSRARLAYRWSTSIMFPIRRLVRRLIPGCNWI